MWNNTHLGYIELQSDAQPVRLELDKIMDFSAATNNNTINPILAGSCSKHRDAHKRLFEEEDTGPGDRRR